MRISFGSLTLGLHSVSSCMEARYPQGIQSRWISRKLPHHRPCSGKPCQTGHSGRFVWLNARRSPVRCTAIRLVGCASCPHAARRQAHERDAPSPGVRIMEPAVLRSVVRSRIRIGLSRSEFAGIRSRLAIRVHAHHLRAQRFVSFCAAVIHTRRSTNFTASEVTWSDKPREFRRFPEKRHTGSTSRADSHCRAHV